MPKAIVSLSGGQDSTTCLAQACHDFPGDVEAVCFDYGQRNRIEIEQAKKIADIANVPLTLVQLGDLGRITHNALTSDNVKVELRDNQLPSTFVPGRNLVFLNFAAIVAYEKQCNIIYIGACETDYSGYPDCRNDFIQSTQHTLRLAMETEFEIRTPLMWINKAQTIQLMDKLGHIEWYAHTHTCYEGLRPACGVCPACQLRLKGFKEAGIKDPIDYAITPA